MGASVHSGAVHIAGAWSARIVVFEVLGEFARSFWLGFGALMV